MAVLMGLLNTVHLLLRVWSVGLPTCILLTSVAICLPAQARMQGVQRSDRLYYTHNPTWGFLHTKLAESHVTPFNPNILPQVQVFQHTNDVHLCRCDVRHMLV